jgi:hypothetical protein
MASERRPLDPTFLLSMVSYDVGLAASLFPLAA